MFCPCLFGVLLLFGVVLINGQHHYFMFHIWPHIWVGAFFVLHIIPDILCTTWCFINVTILFGVIAIFDKLLFGN